MTIASTEVKKQYVANGVTVDFAFPYLFLQDDHLKVYLFNLTTGVETEVTVGITKTGAGDPAGGTVTFLAPPAAGLRITLYREVPLTQETDYVENTKFSAEAHERALDLLTMQNQQQKEGLGRAVKLPISAIVSDISLPDPVAGRALKWNTAGTDLENSNYDFDTAVAQSKDARDASIVAQGLAEDARDASIVAQGLAEDARDASIVAQGLAEDARDAAAASAAAVNLPSAAGHGTNYIRQKVTEDGFEYRTSSQVLADIGAPTAADLAVVSTKAQVGIDVGISAYIKADVAGSDAAGVYGRVFSDDFETDTIGATSTNEFYDSANKQYSNKSVGAVNTAVNLAAAAYSALTFTPGNPLSTWFGGSDRSVLTDGNTGTYGLGANSTAWFMRWSLTTPAIVQRFDFRSEGGQGNMTAYTVEYSTNNGNTWATAASGGALTNAQQYSWTFNASAETVTDIRLSITWSVGNALNPSETAIYASTVTKTNMTLVSGAIALASEPNDVSLYFAVRDVDAVTNGVDRKVYASIDGGVTYAEAGAYTVVGSWGSTDKLLRADVNVAAQTGTSLKWKLETLNAKEQQVKQVTGYAA